MNTLTLIMIVKNESLIIERCLDSIKDHINYIVISDTGSTDNTVDIINNYLIKHNINGKVYNDEWKNFGYNRTKSLTNGQEWLESHNINKKTNYFITIDADMIILFDKEFNKSDLNKYESWSICQFNNSIRYYNSRIFRSDLPFKCVSVTHEYWTCDISNIQGKIETISIDDRGDGGCKADKFTRDIELLTKGLEDEPNNHRYYFYLANSYADIGDIENAIKWYKKRIDAGSWYEEIFISYKRLGELYMAKGEEEKALYYWTLAYEVIPNRSETIIKICNYYRNKGKNYASLLYLKTGLQIEYPNDLVLFLEYPVYNYKFIEELSIIAYYVNKKHEGLLACQYILLNKTYDIPDSLRNSTFSNNFFYIKKIDNKENKKLLVESKDESYICSSASLLFNKNKSYKGVVRAVNYSITDNFEYKIRDKNNNVCTKNYWVDFDKNGIVKSMYEIECNLEKKRNSHIKGLEDMRICLNKGTNKLYGLAVDWEIGSNNHPSIIFVHLDKDDSKESSSSSFSKGKEEKYVINNGFQITYNDNICQKNWTLFNEGSKMYALYSHHPLTILEIDIENKNYKVIKEQYTNYNLSDIRGSANPIRIPLDNTWLILVHEVVHKNTRKYYHRFLRYSNNWDLLDISEPFYFNELFVEFSLSIMYDRSNNNVMILYSSRDNTTEMMTVDYSYIPWLPRDIKKYLIEKL